MSSKGAFFQGLLLWQKLRWWETNPNRAGASRLTGVRRKDGYLQPGSPNLYRDVTVHTSIEPVGTQDDLSEQATLHAQILQMAAALASLSKESGSLAWVDDMDRRAVVSGGPYAAPGPQPVAHAAPGGSWVPTSGRYVLLRNPSTREGFVTLIIGTGPGNVITCTLEQEVTAGWEFFDCQMHYPGAIFERMAPGAPAQTGSDVYRFDVAYEFTANEDAVMAADYLIDMSG